jgi:indole-3-glycerol phosphate synthase
MACLTEVHDEADLERALAAGAGIIGINNRDLASFAVDIGTTFRLRREVPAGKLVVSESGIEAPGDLLRLAEADIDAALIGTCLMRAADPLAKLRELTRALPQRI